MNAMLGEVTLNRRRKKLGKSLEGRALEMLYAATISGFKSLQGGMSKLGMEVLMWVSQAASPLHIDGLCQALGGRGLSTWIFGAFL